MDHPFRSAAFGGFNRQDVLDYLEKTSAENGLRQRELQEKLEAAQEECRQLTVRTTEQEEQLAILRRDRDNLNQQLEQVQGALEESQGQGEAQEEELAALRRERDEWKAKAEALEPDASAYGILKERTAGVELEAHRRAQTVLDQADTQAKELRRNMEQWMDRVEREYDALRSEVEATVSHAADKLEKAGKCLQQVSELLADQDMALEALSQAYDGTAPDKVPAPVPLNED